MIVQFTIIIAFTIVASFTIIAYDCHLRSKYVYRVIIYYCNCFYHCGIITYDCHLLL
jgi:hypothetical protein